MHQTGYFHGVVVMYSNYAYCFWRKKMQTEWIFFPYSPIPNLLVLPENGTFVEKNVLKKSVDYF